MTTSGSDGVELIPIDQLARQFGLRASALRYYEEIGLLAPVSRHSGRRWYGPDEVRRVAIIRYWQDSGLMGLNEIAQLVAGPTANRRWRQVLEDRVESLRAQMAKMEEARSVLEHVVAHHEDAPDGCPYYEALLWGSEAPQDHMAYHDHPASHDDTASHDHGAGRHLADSPAGEAPTQVPSGAE